MYACVESGRPWRSVWVIEDADVGDAGERVDQAVENVEIRYALAQRGVATVLVFEVSQTIARRIVV
jgi:hypothetical protein